MYLDHFGLSCAPFSTTPDTRFFLELNNARTLFKELLASLNAPDGFMIVRGKAGMGKTILCHKLMNALRCHKRRYHLIHIPHPRLSQKSFLSAIAHELQLDEAQSPALENAVVEALALNVERGLVNALIIDEAQSMPDEALECLRTLADRKTSTGHLLRVVLFAQPSRRKDLRQSRSRILADRVTVERNMTPLQVKDTVSYVNLRLNRSGYTGEPLFTPKALHLLGEASSGIPRIINLLAHKSMLLAAEGNERKIDKQHVKLAILSTDATEKIGRNTAMEWIEKLTGR
jgi:MSHA biogenesis protein MshM